MFFGLGHPGRQMLRGSAAGGGVPPGATLDLNFMQPGVLDPRINFTRASSGTYFDSSGVMQAAGFNYTTNNMMVGAVAGTPGTDPTSWNLAFNLLAGLTKQIVGVGTVNGINYIDVRYFGTSSGGNFFPITYSSGGGGGATTAGTQWSVSCYMALVGGTLTNVTNLFLAGQLDSGVSSINIDTRPLLTPTFTRIAASGPAQAGAAVSDGILWNIALAAGPIDFTLRIGAPQWERASAPTPVVPTYGAANGAPRWDYDPVTLALRGLLIEEQRQNLWLQSADASNVAWTYAASLPPAAPVATGNQTTAPDGTLTAARIVYPAVSGGSNYSIVYQAITITAQPYAFSVWLKGSVGGEQINVGVIGNASGSIRATLTTQWQRFVMPTVSSAAGSAFFEIGCDFRDPSQSAIAAQTIYAWGAQVEAGAFATSYIPTTAAAVTRAIDVASMPTDTWFNASAMSVAINAMSFGFGSAGYNVLYGLNDGSDNNRLQQGLLAPPMPIAPDSLVVSGGTASVALPETVAVPTNVLFKFGASLKAGAFASSLNGAAPYVNTTGIVMPIGINHLAIGNSGATFSVDGYIQRLRYWPRALSNTELQSITTTPLEPPALNLDFMNPGTLDPRINFSRGSTATYFDASGTVRSAGVNAPRWDYDPATHALRGLLIEEARTNLQFPSVNFFTASAPSGSTEGIVHSVGQGLAGSNDAMALIPGAFSGVHQFYALYAGAVSTTYIFSIYAKAAGMNFVELALENSGFAGTNQNATFNLSTGTIDSQTTGASAQIQACGNGWYRCSMVATSAASSGAYVNNIYPNSVGGGVGVTTGNGVDGIWVWGQQVEAGTFPTSYIPTVGASVTRAQDVCYIPVGPWFNPNTETLMTESYNPVCLGVWAGIGDNNFNNALYEFSGGAVRGATVASTIPTAGAVNKQCAALAGASRVAVSVNGGSVGSATISGQTQPTATALSIGMSPWALDSAFNSHMRNVRYWPRVLSDTDLQAITK